MQQFEAKIVSCVCLVCSILDQGLSLLAPKPVYFHGVHSIAAFFGCAIQIGWILESEKGWLQIWALPTSCHYVLTQVVRDQEWWRCKLPVPAALNISNAWNRSGSPNSSLGFLLWKVSIRENFGSPTCFYSDSTCLPTCLCCVLCEALGVASHVIIIAVLGIAASNSDSNRNSNNSKTNSFNSNRIVVPKIVVVIVVTLIVIVMVIKMR